MIVVDSSVVVPTLADDGTDGRRARSRMRGEALAAPQLVTLEAAAAIRGLERGRRLTSQRAEQALTDLTDLPVAYAPHAPLLARIWQLRHNLTPYDAAYVVLAELLSAVLVTADGRLAAAPGVRCAIELLNGS